MSKARNISDSNLDNLTVNSDLDFNSGYGSAAIAYGCRAWVNFKGTSTVSVRESGNVSSVTDNGTGYFTLNFTTTMPDVNYNMTGSVSQAGICCVANSPSPTTSALRVAVTDTSGNLADRNYVNVSIFR